MAEAALLALAWGLSACGLAWLALAMESHWQQVRAVDTAPSPRTVCLLRGLGAAALVASLLACLQADHATMAVLVWVMSMTGGALLVAFTLAWRPRSLAWLAGPLS